MPIHPPCPAFGVDRIGWKGEKSGSFSVKSAYFRLTGFGMVQGVNVWSTIWKLQLPQRIHTFVWLSLRDSLLTNANRVRRHMAASPCCGLCYNGYKDLTHALRDCLRVKEVWNQVVPSGF
ncbi:hypothetical protein like AT3G09510 [Hibiscus trionum]|uniref:Reverse transcriptase zinc-binding domain-containing protein n=1 Tax=Hibiscus trionum TaxID=183268 RepID=A0A9W7HL28_HIBTR|nr:hypothetical protein like AT3G09510 [Hibiscus trionum]